MEAGGLSRRGVLSFARGATSLRLLWRSAVPLAACGGSSSHSLGRRADRDDSAAATASAASKPAGAPCRTVAVPAPKGPQHLKAPTLKLDPAKTYTVTIATNCGTFAFTLDVKHSPKTSASFYSLVRRGLLRRADVPPGRRRVRDPGRRPERRRLRRAPATRSSKRRRGTRSTCRATSRWRRRRPAVRRFGQPVLRRHRGQRHPVGRADARLRAGRQGRLGLDVVKAIGALPTNPPGDGTPTPAVVMSKVTSRRRRRS